MMHFSKAFLHFLRSFVFLPGAVLANLPRTGYVNLINATPFDWQLISCHAYQLEWNFPKVVKAGTSHEQFIKFKKDHHDDGAEAYYTLANSPSPASFVVKARAPKHIEIQFQETLSSLSNPENSVINLGFVENGAVSFVLSGNGETPYVSSNPPVAWMQSTLSSIGSKSLRQISMPASHDSGMSEISLSWGGVKHNTVTQTANTFQQLVNGARIFDIRPVQYHGRIYTGHFQKIGNSAVGGTGRQISDVVNDINAFTNQYPGELIILDISHQMVADKKFRDFGPNVWMKLYQELNKIRAIWVASSSNVPDDLSSLPLSTFITPGSKSAVLVRLPNGVPLPESAPKSRSFSKRNIGVVATYANDARADPTDGMAALGPALAGDDSDNFTFTDHGASVPTPTVLPSAQSGGGDGSSAASDDDIDSLDSDNRADPLPPSMTLLPLPTYLPKLATYSEPMPAEVPVQFGSSSMAFFHESRLPISGSYTDTDKSKRLIADQLAKLARDRPNTQAEVHRSTWTSTQRWRHITDAGNPKTSLIADAVPAHRALFGNLWPAMSRNTYPNMIEVDDIHNSHITALCMAINDYFASPRILSRSTRGFMKRSKSETFTTKSERNTGVLEALSSLEKLTLSDSGCDVGEIVFANRKSCWDIITPEEGEPLEKKAQLMDRYTKGEMNMEKQVEGHVEKELKKLHESRKKLGLREVALFNSTLVADSTQLDLALTRPRQFNSTEANHSDRTGIPFEA